jgi:hypothetical protein
MPSNSRPGPGSSALANKLKHKTPAPATSNKAAGSSSRHGSKKPAPPHASTGGPFASQISSEAQLKFGPQLDTLGTLLRQAVSSRDQGIAVQKSTGTGLINLASRAQPVVQQIAAQGAQRVQQPYAQVQADIAGLGPSADPIRAATARDAALVQAQQGLMTQDTATELKQRQVDALAGRQAGISAVQQQYSTDVGKIGDQLSSITGQQGAFGASRLAELLGEQRKQDFTAQQNQLGRDVTTRGQDLSHQDRVAAQKGKKSATGKKLQPGGAHNTAKEKIATGLAALRDLDPDKAHRHDTAPGLVQGAPADKGTPIYRTETDPITKKTKQVPVLNPDGTVKTSGDLPAIPGVGSWATIAADVYYDGHLSRKNQKALADAGFSIKELGLPTYAQWKRQRARQPQQHFAARAPGGT